MFIFGSLGPAVPEKQSPTEHRQGCPSVSHLGVNFSQTGPKFSDILLVVFSILDAERVHMAAGQISERGWSRRQSVELLKLDGSVRHKRHSEPLWSAWCSVLANELYLKFSNVPRGRVHRLISAPRATLYVHIDAFILFCHSILLSKWPCCDHCLTRIACDGETLEGRLR